MKFLPIAAAIILSACTAPRDPDRVYTVSGHDLGSNTPHAIGLSESKVSFVGESDPVRSRVVFPFRDRYTEQLVLSNDAVLKYSKPYLAGFTPRDTIEDLLKTDLTQDFYRKKGIVWVDGGTRKSRLFSYVVLSSASEICFVFHGFFGDTTLTRGDSPGNQEIGGSECYPVAARTADALEREMLDLLGRARFDGGEINRARVAGSYRASVTEIP